MKPPEPTRLPVASDQGASASEAELPLRRVPPAHLDETELRRRFELERRLADKLRVAAAEVRPALYSKVYDAYYTALGSRERTPDLQLAKLQRSLLQPFLRPATRFLEVGAGSAELARGLSEEGFDVTVIEASREALGPSRQSSSAAAESLAGGTSGADGSGGLHWVAAADAGSELVGSRFDLAFSSHFVEHLHADDLQEHLRDVLSWMAPGGRYVVVTPNRLCGPHDVSGYFSTEALGFHLREYTHGELAEEMCSAGWTRPAALRGVGVRPRVRSLRAIRVAEALLAVLGQRLRAKLYESDLWAPRRPFRPLEQVVVVAQRAS